MNTGKVVAAPENSTHDDDVSAAGGVDDLGPLPMGDGRQDAPAAAYTSPVMVICTVADLCAHDDFRWTRLIQRRGWRIVKNAAGTRWVVTQFRKRGFPAPADDTGDPAYNTRTPSPLKKLYIYDNSALSPNISGANAIGDFAYEEKDFLYRIEHRAGGVWRRCAEFHVGQKIVAERVGSTGVVATDWRGAENSTAVRTLDASVTEAKVRAIVGAGLPIDIDAHAND